jgi:thymidine kinase
MGSLEILIGPMFADKTTTLVRKLKQHMIAKQNVLLIKPSKDIRYTRDGLVSSHDGLCMNAIAVTSLENDPPSLINSNIDVIGIDEGHFFKYLYEFCQRWLARNVKIYVTGLNGTFERKPFESIQKLIPIADNIIFLHGVCIICNSTKGSCSVKIVSQIHEDVDGICVGGDETYSITCAACYQKEITKDHIRERRQIIESTKKLIKYV